MEHTEPTKITCPITGGTNCFEQVQTAPDGQLIKSYLSIDSGYTTTTLNVEGSEAVVEYELATPELIKDLRWVDPQTNLVWYPLVLNFPTFGIIFPDGSSKDDWQWMAAPAVDIPTKDKNKYPIPGQEGQFYTRKIDMEAGKKFAPNQFEQAAKFVGFIV